MNIKAIFFSAILMLVFVGCKDNATAKIDENNLENAKARDAQLTTGFAAISFDKTEHDFGTINEGDVVETTFEVTNTGKVDLVITDAFATCGCTVPEWPKEPIKPNEKGILKVSFDSNGKPNKQSKTITIVANTENGQETVTISTFVTPKNK
ncbi:MAG TPA: DUF1573 domain-containing protein [Flavobacteriaceae bacterium]|nr:DUF1573 domain-containing protein [Flavobacteriaceae bacterium]HEX5742386.1 DUF1573 domain-containing protein [Flavobacteriaceae bacterium]